MQHHQLNLPEIIVLFAIVLGFMVLVHELGHFIVAKLCGVKVEAFSIGFGPRLFGIKYGETDYKVCALPLGGYVKMSGEIPGEVHTEGQRDFSAHPRWQRVLIALAGPFANFILSFVLLALVAHYHHEVQKFRTGPAVVDYVPLNTPAAKAGLSTGDTIVGFNDKQNPTWDVILREAALNMGRVVSFSYQHDGNVVSRDIQIIDLDGSRNVNAETLPSTGLIAREQTDPLGIEKISGGTPADRAGLKAGDHILQIDNVAPHSVETMHAYLHDRNGVPSTISILRGGQTMAFTLAAEKIDGAPAYADYQIGFSAVPTPVDVVQLPIGEAISQSFADNRDNSTLILRVLKGMFTRHVSVKSLSGPVGIAQQIGIAFSYGAWTLVELMANISMNLGIFNLLPIPILDGGMIVFLLIESIIRRDVNEQVKERVYQVAFVCIIMLAFFVIFNDITRIYHH